MRSVLFGALFAASTAIAGCRSANQPDPVTYALRFQPDSLSLPVGARGSLSMFATTTSGSDVDIRLVEWVVDDQTIATLDTRAPTGHGDVPLLSIRELTAADRTGLREISVAALDVRPGEIVGIAGISGNGQKEFLEVLAGQRERRTGRILVK